MRRISFNPRFINKENNDLILGKIHTIRSHYNFWKRFEGQEVALFTWTGKPYRSKQKVFCVKRIVSVQALYYNGARFMVDVNSENGINIFTLSANDGFNEFSEFIDWFTSGNYKPGKLAILHFTDFKY